MQPITEELIREIKDRIITTVHPEKIIVFGLYAYGTPTKDSDLDLLVIMPSYEPMNRRVLPIRKLLRDFHVPKDIIVYTPEEVKKWKDASVAFITISAFICVHLRLNKLIFRQQELHNNPLVKRHLCI